MNQDITAPSPHRKLCSAYCTALSYNIKSLSSALKAQYKVTSYKHLIHLELDEGDVFIFPFGTFVTWSVPEEEVQLFIQALKPFEEQPLQKIERDSFSYVVASSCSLNDEKITINSDETMPKMAFSHGLAQSVKISVFEESIGATIEKTKEIPQQLAQKGKITLSRKDIRRQIGALFMERSAINLHLDVLDTPEFFWEHPQFERLYASMDEELDLKSRTSALNKQLDVLHNLFEVLNSELSDQHSSRLEWAIIWLIVIEVVLVLTHDILKLI